MEQPSQTNAAMEKHVALFLATSPVEPDRFALDREARAIRAELKDLQRASTE
jgi:hypothetical protein